MSRKSSLTTTTATAFGSMPSPFFTTPAARVAWARQRYFEDGERPSGIVSEPVIQSWQRCLAAGLRPQEKPAFDPVSRSRISAALSRSHALLQAAAPELDQLDLLLAGTGCRLVLTDGQGIVLRATAAPLGGRGLLDLGTRRGVDLGEDLCGSTAPGVSSRSGRACTVSGAEHFFGVLEQVHCAAVPIRNGHGSVAGVLDLSIEGRPFAFDAFSLVRLFATAIENRLAAALAHDQLLVRFQVAPGMLGTPMEGLAIVDSGGRVGWVNAAGSALLEHAGPGERQVEPLFGLTLQQLLRLGAPMVPATHRLPSGLGVWIAVTEPASRRPAPPPLATTLPQASLDDVHRRHIEDTLAAHGGNIAAAARQLGVSRGLLYRRLRQWRAGDDAAALTCRS